MTLNCDELDDYLDDTLSHERRERFRLHLDACAACRDSVESQQRIERLLRQATRVEPPGGLRFRIERQVQIAARRCRVMAVALTAAAAALVMYFSIPQRPSVAPPLAQRPQIFDVPRTPHVETAHGESSGTTEIANSSAVTEEPSPPEALVTVVTDDEVIAVLRPSKHANVSVYLLYPTVRTAASAPPASNETQDSTLRENAL